MEVEVNTASPTKYKAPKSNLKHLDLYKELKALVEGYRGGLMSLSQKIQVSKPTLWRWANLKNTRPPNAHNVLSLLKFLKKETDLHAIVNGSSPEIYNFLKKSFKGELERTTSSRINNDLDSLFEDFHFYFIHLLVNTEKKMSRNEIKKIIGLYSLDQIGLSIEDESLKDDFLIQLGFIADHKIDLLIGHNIISESNNIIQNKITNPKISLRLTKKHLPKLFSFFKEYNMVNSNNMFYSYQECLNKETINKVLRIQYDAFMDCYKIMEKEKTETGEIYLLTSFFDSLNN